MDRRKGFLAGPGFSSDPPFGSYQYGFKSYFLWAFLLLIPFSFSCDRIRVYLHPNEGKIGFIDHQGNYVIKPQFHWIQGFKGNVAAVEVDTAPKSADGTSADVTSKFGAINLMGELIVPLEYQTVRALGDGFIMAQNDKGWLDRKSVV